MLGNSLTAAQPRESAEVRARTIFEKMDENNDGHLSQEEFLNGCLQDEDLSKMLAPNMGS